MKIYKTMLSCCLLLILSGPGCATLRIQSFVTHAERPPSATQFFQTLDQVVKQSRVRDAADFPVLGFPYLRANGYLVGLKNTLDTADKKALWVDNLRQVDLTARKKEVHNLPEARIREICQSFGLPPDKNALIQKIDLLGQELSAHDQQQNLFYETITQAVRYRSEYSEVMRAVGLYPVIAPIVYLATKIVYAEFADWHRQPENKIKIRGELKSFAPPPHKSLSPDIVRRLLSKRDIFGAPQLTGPETQELALAFAPVIKTDVVANYDRIGEVVWNQGQIKIDTAKPTVYYYLSYSFINNQPVLQINYAFWFTRRAGSAPFIEHGSLDGLTARLTLDAQGTPLVFDTTNNCGCYYFLIPRQDKITMVSPNRWSLNLLQPAWLPADFPPEPLSLWVVSGWHQIARVTSGEPSPSSVSYQLLPYDLLENLPLDTEASSTASAFDEHGIMKNSFRIEPALFFPMGIYKVGYMRQRGHHAIKLVGKEHFTAPRLFDNALILK